MTWNLENLFDDITNGTEYRDYIPGEDSWTSEDFHGKMAALAQGIQSAVRGGPDVLLLQEIENLNTLTVFNESYLKGMGYKYIVFSEPGDQAVAAGVLSRYPVSQIYFHNYSLPESPANRSILEVRIQFPEETVIFFNNHWKSKLGGQEATETVRREAASLLNRRIRQIREEEDPFPMVIGGDLNEDIDEFEKVGKAWQTALLGIENLPDLPEENYDSSLIFTGDPGALNIGSHFYFSPWPSSEDPGSYFYNNQWEKIDHFFLTSEFFDQKGLEYHEFRALRKDFMLSPEGTPRRWDRNRKEGFSDHLALILILEAKP